jgi:hypothetical protein
MRKIKFMLTLLSICFGAVCYAQATTQDTSIAIKNAKVMPAYFELKNDLLSSDSIKAAASALALWTELPHIHLRAHQLDELISLKKLRVKILDEAQQVSATKNINKQRQHFAILSKDLWTLATSYKFTVNNAYYDQCPMTGVTWISDKKEIANPYYPKNMRTCGQVKDQIEQAR